MYLKKTKTKTKKNKKQKTKKIRKKGGGPKNKYLNNIIEKSVLDLGFQIISSKDDSNSFFNSISTYFNLNGENFGDANTLRQNLVYYIISNEEIKSYLVEVGGIDFNQLNDELQMLEKKNTSDIELFDFIPSIIATQYNISICIFNWQKNSSKGILTKDKLCYSPLFNKETEIPIIYLVNINNIHYDLLVPINKEVNNNIKLTTPNIPITIPKTNELLPTPNIPITIPKTEELNFSSTINLFNVRNNQINKISFNSQSIQTIFLSKNTYEYIYISFGCKINENNTNATCQMFPTFLENAKSLVVLIDDFSESSSFSKENFDIIRKYSIKHNCDIFILSTYFNNINDIFNLYQQFCLELDSYIVNKWIIASYYRFKNENQPNFSEKQFYDSYMLMLKEKFSTIPLNKYSKNIFIWCGYNIKYLKNIIYSLDFYISNPSYEKLEFLNNLSFNTILNILNSYKQSYLQDDEISCKNIKNIIQDILSKNYDNYNGITKSEVFKLKRDKLVIFLKNSIDICCNYYKNDLIVSNDNLYLYPKDL
jgi:hypothetical protein